MKKVILMFYYKAFFNLLLFYTLWRSKDAEKKQQKNRLERRNTEVKGGKSVRAAAKERNKSPNSWEENDWLGVREM